MANFSGTTGNDNLTGTTGNDKFDMSQGGDDIVSGLDGRDLFSYGAAFNANDQVDGGAGADILRLAGDYSAGVVFNANTMVNVEEIQLTGGNSYKLTTDDANIAAGTIFTLDARALGASDKVNFNGGDESDARFKLLAGAGNDTLRGGALADSFDLSAGGNDTAAGGSGNDTFIMGAALTAADRIDGGTGNDVVTLNGDYSNGLTLGPATFVRVETLKLTAGHDYDITADDGTVAAGQSFTVDASALGAGDSLTYDAAAESNANYVFIGGAGDDVITGAEDGTISFSIGNTFDLRQGGNDIATGGQGSDTFNMGAAMTSRDQIDGGAGATLTNFTGNDTVILSGDYTGGNALVLRNSTIQNIGDMELVGGHNYDITTARQTVSSLGMTIDATRVATGNSVDFDGSASRGAIHYNAGTGDNTFLGGNQSDSYTAAPSGGTTHVSGNDGNDFITVGASFSATDSIDGGAGNDSVTFAEPVTVVLGPTTITNVENFLVQDAVDITTDDATVAAGDTLLVRIGLLRGGTTVFDGSAETDGHFNIIENFGSATLTGGALSDTFSLDHRATNIITGGGGADLIKQPTVGQIDFNTFVYDAVSDSTSVNYDTIQRVNFDRNDFNVSSVTTVTGIDAAVTTGSLSTASFDTDLANDVGSGQLAAGHAVLFTANAGTLSGHTFLVIDANGIAGYQASADLVIDVTGAAGTLALSSF